MAATKSNATPETTLPDNHSVRGTSEISVEYHALIEWIKLQEEKDATLRVIAITTSDANAPTSERLAYSYPAVEQGANGYRDSKGNTVLFTK